MPFTDQLNRAVVLKKSPKRIVSLVPSQTELLCYLGLAKYIVGVTKFCVHPNNIKKNATIVGGTKQINLDKLRLLKPDIVLCNKEENTKDIVDACQLVCPVHVSNVFNISSSIELIQHYGHVFNIQYEALLLIKKIEQEVLSFKKLMGTTNLKRVAYFIWKTPWMVAGNNTYINAILDLNKFDNIYADKERYPEININNLEVNNQVDLVLLSSEPYPFSKKHLPDIKPFYPNAKIVCVDGEMFSWYGSRLLLALKYFTALH